MGRQARAEDSDERLVQRDHPLAPAGLGLTVLADDTTRADPSPLARQVELAVAKCHRKIVRVLGVIVTSPRLATVKLDSPQLRPSRWNDDEFLFLALVRVGKSVRGPDVIS